MQPNNMNSFSRKSDTLKTILNRWRNGNENNDSRQANIGELSFTGSKKCATVTLTQELDAASRGPSKKENLSSVYLDNNSTDELELDRLFLTSHGANYIPPPSAKVCDTGGSFRSVNKERSLRQCIPPSDISTDQNVQSNRNMSHSSSHSVSLLKAGTDDILAATAANSCTNLRSTGHDIPKICSIGDAESFFDSFANYQPSGHFPNSTVKDAFSSPDHVAHSDNVIKNIMEGFTVQQESSNVHNLANVLEHQEPSAANATVTPEGSSCSKTPRGSWVEYVEGNLPSRLSLNDMSDEKAEDTKRMSSLIDAKDDEFVPMETAPFHVDGGRKGKKDTFTQKQKKFARVPARTNSTTAAAIETINSDFMAWQLFPKKCDAESELSPKGEEHFILPGAGDTTRTCEKFDIIFEILGDESQWASPDSASPARRGRDKVAVESPNTDTDTHIYGVTFLMGLAVINCRIHSIGSMLYQEVLDIVHPTSCSDSRDINLGQELKSFTPFTYAPGATVGYSQIKRSLHSQVEYSKNIRLNFMRKTLAHTLLNVLQLEGQYDPSSISTTSWTGHVTQVIMPENVFYSAGIIKTSDKLKTFFFGLAMPFWAFAIGGTVPPGWSLGVGSVAPQLIFLSSFNVKSIHKHVAICSSISPDKRSGGRKSFQFYDPLAGTCTAQEEQTKSRVEDTEIEMSMEKDKETGFALGPYPVVSEGLLGEPAPDDWSVPFSILEALMSAYNAQTV